mgnify:CR=1 FL=1
MPALSRLNHCFVSILFVHVGNLFLAKLAHSFLCFFLHYLIVCHCSFALTWVHEVVHLHLVRAHLVHLWLFLVWWHKSRFDLGRVDHVHIALFLLLVEWIWQLDVCSSAACAQMENSLEFLCFLLGQAAWWIFVHYICQDFSEIRISILLHVLAWVLMCLNLFLWFERVSAVAIIHWLIGILLYIDALCHSSIVTSMHECINLVLTCIIECWIVVLWILICFFLPLRHRFDHASISASLKHWIRSWLLHLGHLLIGEWITEKIIIFLIII